MSAETQSGANATCPQHPGIVAEFICTRCQAAVCVECCYSMPEGGVCCKSCYQTEVKPKVSATLATTPSLRLAPSQPMIQQYTLRTVAPSPGQACVQHPHVMSVARCQSCGAGSCWTCDFVFPSNLHYCPVCVGSATGKISPRRKKYMIAAFVLAAWSSLGFVGFISGALAGLAEGDGGQMLLGVLLLLLVGVPAIVGTALGMSARRSGGPNPVSVWIALIWNSLVLSGLILLVIVGHMSN